MTLPKRAILFSSLLAASCGRRDGVHGATPVGEASGNATAAASDVRAPGAAQPAPNPAQSASNGPSSDGPRIASNVIAATIYKLPDTASRKLGYVRLGGSVRRDAEPVEGNGCKHAFYHVYPVGYMCTDEATTDLSAPIVRAASV